MLGPFLCAPPDPSPGRKTGVSVRKCAEVPSACASGSERKRRPSPCPLPRVGGAEESHLFSCPLPIANCQLPVACCPPLKKNAPERRWASLGGWALERRPCLPHCTAWPASPWWGRDVPRVNAEKCSKPRRRRATRLRVARPRVSVARGPSSEGHSRRARSVSPGVRRGSFHSPTAAPDALCERRRLLDRLELAGCSRPSERRACWPRW